MSADRRELRVCVVVILVGGLIGFLVHGWPAILGGLALGWLAVFGFLAARAYIDR